MIRVRTRMPLVVRLAGLGLAGATILAPQGGRADPPGVTASWSYLDRALVAAATRRAIARAGLSPERTREIAGRARTAGLLPSMTLRVMRGIGATSALTAALPASDRYSSDDSLVIDVRARFDLDRLLFDRAEVTLERLEMARADRREAIEREVIEQLAILARAAATPVDPAHPSVESQIATARARARLEAMTGDSLETLIRLR